MRLRLPSSRVRVVLALAVIFATGLGLAMSRNALMAARQAGRAAPEADWTCPMHPDVHQSHPGDCPICGMTLERNTASAKAEAHGEAHESRAETANPARPGVAAPEHEEVRDPRAPVEIDTRRQQLLGVAYGPGRANDAQPFDSCPGHCSDLDESCSTKITPSLEELVVYLDVDRTGQAVKAVSGVLRRVRKPRSRRRRERQAGGAVVELRSYASAPRRRAKKQARTVRRSGRGC